MTVVYVQRFRYQESRNTGLESARQKQNKLPEIIDIIVGSMEYHNQVFKNNR